MADIVDMIYGDTYNLKTLSRAIRESGLEDTLRGSGPFTVFAPVDGAFSKLSDSAVDDLFGNKSRLKAIVTYHVVPEKLFIDDLRKTETVTTLQGQVASVDPHMWHLHMNPKISGINIIRTDVVADNGVIHEIDSVMMPNLDLTCPICGLGFLSQTDLDTHTNTAHPPVHEEAVSPPAAAAPVEAVSPPEPVATTPAPEPTPESTFTHIEVAAAPIAAAAVTVPVVEKVARKRRTTTRRTTAGTTTREKKSAKPALSRGAKESTFEVHFDDRSNKYMYHMKEPNGDIIGESESFRSVDDLNDGIKLVQRNAPLAKTVCAEPTSRGGVRVSRNISGPFFEEFKDDNGKWRFTLRESSDGPVILKSRKAYNSINSCNDGIDLVKKNASDAKTIYPESSRELLTH